LRFSRSGDLDNSWRQQPGTPAYCRDLEIFRVARLVRKTFSRRATIFRHAEALLMRTNFVPMI
jgi:hypothetical protein